MLGQKLIYRTNKIYLENANLFYEIRKNKLYSCTPQMGGLGQSHIIERFLSRKLSLGITDNKLKMLKMSEKKR